MAGYEIAYTGGLGKDLKGAMVVYLAAGSNPMTSSVWQTYVPPPDYSLNTPRVTWFNQLNLLGSPYVPTGEITHITTSDGYTWDSVAAVQRSIYPYVPITVNGQTLSPQQIAYAISTPPEGNVLVDSNDKNHENVYYGINGSHPSDSHIQYFVNDPWGNTYILKSLNAANSSPELVAQAVAESVLPPGWTKLAPAYFLNDIGFTSSYSGAGNSIAHANEFRDSSDSAWMQISWADNGITLNAAAAGGLPIWAGASGGNLLGTTNNDVIYGAQGKDFISGGKGDDHIDGGAGINHAIYSGTYQQYSISVSNNNQVKITDTVANRDGSDTLDRIQWLDFADISLSVNTSSAQPGVQIGQYLNEGTLNWGGPEAISTWLAHLDNRNDLTNTPGSFINSAESVSLYASDISNSHFFDILYSNIVG